MAKGYFSPEIKIYFFSLAEDVLTLSSNNEQFDNGATDDGNWEDFLE